MALHDAVEQSKKNQTKLVLRRVGMQWSLEDSLVDAATRGDVAQMAEYVGRGADVNGENAWGHCALGLASFHGEVECVKVSWVDEGGGEERVNNIVQYLLGVKADVNRKGLGGATPAMFAADHGHLECLKMLLDAGASVEDCDEEGHTALHRAAMFEESSVACLEVRGQPCFVERCVC